MSSGVRSDTSQQIAESIEEYIEGECYKKIGLVNLRDHSDMVYRLVRYQGNWSDEGEYQWGNSKFMARQVVPDDIPQSTKDSLSRSVGGAMTALAEMDYTDFSFYRKYESGANRYDISDVNIHDLEEFLEIAEDTVDEILDWEPETD